VSRAERVPAAAKRRGRGAQPAPETEDGFPLWPGSDGPTQPIVVKPEAERPAATASPDAGTAWQATEIQMMRGGRKTTTKRPPQAPPKRVRKKYRSPAVGLTALVLFALLAGFFGWVSADPFWLAIGHSERGTATVTKCVGSGIQARCVGNFTGSTFNRSQVAVSALTRAEQKPGMKVPARMVSSKGRIAYAGRMTPLHLRWIVGIALVLLCGLVITWATGAGRLETRRARVAAFAMSMGGPLLLAAGAFAISW
jgi:hypothetical protein